jgi:hypothetical protein
LSGAHEVVSFLNHLNIGHELLSPVDRAGADQEDGKTEREAQGEVARAHGADNRQRDHGVLVDCLQTN